jgi:hypothetical protein
VLSLEGAYLPGLQPEAIRYFLEGGDTVYYRHEALLIRLNGDILDSYHTFDLRSDLHDSKFARRSILAANSAGLKREAAWLEGDFYPGSRQASS